MYVSVGEFEVVVWYFPQNNVTNTELPDSFELISLFECWLIT